MPIETYNFTYNEEATEITVVATMKDLNGIVIDTISKTISIVPVAPYFLGTPQPNSVNIPVGQTASILEPEVSGIPTPTVSYSWSLDGVVIQGATGTSYLVDSSGSLTAGISASNNQGSITAEIDFGTSFVRTLPLFTIVGDGTIDGSIQIIPSEDFPEGVEFELYVEE